MRNITLLAVLLLVLTSCMGRKQIEKQLNSGNYDQAINNALKKLKRNKDKQRKQDYVIMLENAFYKVVEDNHNNINHLKKESNPELYEQIFNTYLDLEDRQRAIKAVLPLQINGKTLELNFNDYSNSIVEYRAKVSEHKYIAATLLLNSTTKQDNRRAYTLLKGIEAINMNYKDVRQLMAVAHHQGTDYVIVNIKNQTRQIIPRGLENDLLDFNTYGLNDFWTAYHTNTNSSIVYDYAMDLKLKRINISPERITEKQLLRQKTIKDGWEYVYDTKGNVAKDSLGNDIKQDKLITAKARLNEFNQLKSTQVIASVVYSDLKQNQVIERFPIESEFVFDNLYATVKGDKRALTSEDITILKNKKIRFPSNEQMVFDTGEDLKLKLKNIIKQVDFKG